MTVTLAQSSFLVPVQEIYCVCSGLNAHWVISAPDTAQKDCKSIESEGGQWEGRGGEEEGNKQNGERNI